MLHTLSTPFEIELMGSQQLLKRQALHLTGSTEEAKDLLQETLFKALKYKHLFKEGTNLSAWLYTIMRNTFITRKTSEKHYKRTVDTESGERLLVSKSERNKAYTQFAWEELQKALEKVDKSLRTPFLLHCSGFKYREIAEDLQLPEGTVKNRIHLAKKELQLLLSSYKDTFLD